MAVDARRVKELFGAALDIPETAARNAYLDRECGDNAELRQRLDALLKAHESPASVVMQPLAGEGTVAYAASEKPGTLVAGRYKLLESIGEGGMGTVWVAEQTEPVKRKVAVKLIKAGMDSRSVLARFEAERQALALMDHPNIAKVLDGGLTEQGRPYFVMEYVKGVPITEYCDATRLSIHERLQLFIQVCQAVQHAHQKGIIHRDLKPSNILVAPYDDKPVPKIIDFGLAKAMHQSLTERTLHTAHESVLGTPLYMSPEQAQLNNLDVDTRSDIYSLGVLLYELLTGTTPLEKQRFRQAAWDEVRRIIREEEPPRPSTRLSSIDTLPTLAAGRHTDPLKLTKLVKGELDWIVMKALEKDRTRRYETANGFARDIQRYLSDEVVEARPASAGYRLRKLMARNKGKVLATSLILLALLTGVAVSTWQAVRATRAEHLALAAAEEERKAKQREAERAEGEKQAKEDAVAKRKEAETNLAFAKKANDILGSVFIGLDPKANYATVAELRDVLKVNLRKAVKELEGSAIGDPLEVAAMQNTLGKSLRGLGEAKLAIEVLEKARDTYKAKLGPDHPFTLISMNNLANGYRAAGKIELALPLFEETLKLTKAKLGAEHPITLAVMFNLSTAYYAAGKWDLALRFYEETLILHKAKLGPEHPETLKIMNSLAVCYQDAGKLDLALPLLEETLKLGKAKLGPDHPDTLVSMNNLANGYYAAGKRDLALPLLEETLKLRKAKLGPDHPDTLSSINNLAVAYQDAGKRDLAIPLLEETLKLMKARLGPDHPDTLVSMNNLANGYMAQRKLDQAIPLFKETLQLMKAKLGAEHPSTLNCMYNLSAAYQDAGKLDLALLLRREMVTISRKVYPKNSPQLGGHLASLGLILLEAKSFTEAEPLLRECLTIRENSQPDAWRTFYTQSMLGGALLGQKKYTEAEQLLLKGYEGMKAREKTMQLQDNTRLPEALDRLIQLYTETSKPEEVKKWQAEKEKLPKAKEKKP
ncbi:MAG: tetratricopeptide repeat protein [Planctomycetia bacterium]|nr:tetratricopeptide repeat protein [Planctomycetia bacterium]